jgi:probable Rubsico expression protein CbbX
MPETVVREDALDVGQAFRDSRVEEVLQGLDRDLVGLTGVKTRIREIAAFLLVDRLRRQMGLEADRPVLHMSFTGGPGTGKTTVALRMAQILHRLGYIRRDHLVVATRDDLVGQYVGHTAPKTKEVLKKAMGGLLFIDEAYYLYRRENERDYGQESIEILLQVMENQREDLVVILAGYKDRMDGFFGSNPGLRSRVAHHLDFSDFTLEELMRIAHTMLEQQRYRLDDPAQVAFRAYLQRRMALPDFANARSVRNAIDRIKLRHANRIYSGSGLATREELERIDAADILKSRVFLAAPAPAAPSDVL